MEIDDIKKLMELMEAKGVVELEIKNASGEIRLVRDNNRSTAQVPLSSVVISAPPLHAHSGGDPSPNSSTEYSADTPETQVRGLAIPSPMVGTFYRAPSPDAPAYVDVGSIVEVGDVVCIVEAMKMMNEIQSEARGRVLKVMVENGKAVEYGQPLFLLEPL
ncbi:MAG: acetyl-CoA carboxylase biotin carboxyl carrier protein [Candidatus Binatia bacterium]